MVNNDTNFKSIELLRCWCMKSLPTVFSDALSYNQQVCLLTNAINQMSETVNGLPDYIIALVEELLEQMNLEQIVKEVLSDMYFLNVKNPPNNMTAAIGDGVTDDTTAIQAMIAYLNGRKAYLFFPAGIYSVTGLNVTTNMSLVGFDRYQTTLQLRAGSNKDLLTGDLGACTINDITLDANMPGQTQHCSVFDGNVGNMLVSNVIFKNGYNVLGLDIDGLVQMDNIVFDGVQGNGLSIGGDRAVINDIQFVNNSTLNAGTLITVSGTNSMITGLLNTEGCNTGLNVSGNNNVIIGVIRGATTPIVNTGTDNYIDIIGSVHTVIDGAYTHTINGDFVESANTKTETVTVEVNETYGAITQTINGSKTEDIKNNKFSNISGNNTENISGVKEIQADSIFLNTVEPLKYSKPVNFDSDYGLIEMQDKDNIPYYLITSATKSVPFNDFDGQCLSLSNECKLRITDVDFLQIQGSCVTSDGNIIYAMIPTEEHAWGKTKAKWFKKSLNTFRTLAESEIETYHTNSMTYVPSTNKVLCATGPYVDVDGSTIHSNKMCVINADTLELESTVSIHLADNTPLVFHALSYDSDTNTLYVMQDLTEVYTCDMDTGLATKFVTLKMPKRVPYNNQDIMVKNGYIYKLMHLPNTLFIFNMGGSLIKLYNIPYWLGDYMYTGETESIDYFNGDIWLSTFSYENLYHNTSSLCFNKLNLSTGIYNGLFNDNGGVTQSTGYVVYVDSNSTSAFENGSEDYPFKSLQSVADLIRIQNPNKVFTVNVKSGNYGYAFFNNCSSSCELICEDSVTIDGLNVVACKYINVTNATITNTNNQEYAIRCLYSTLSINTVLVQSGSSDRACIGAIESKIILNSVTGSGALNGIYASRTEVKGIMTYSENPTARIYLYNMSVWQVSPRDHMVPNIENRDFTIAEDRCTLLPSAFRLKNGDPNFQSGSLTLDGVSNVNHLELVVLFNGQYFNLIAPLTTQSNVTIHGSFPSLTSSGYKIGEIDLTVNITSGIITWNSNKTWDGSSVTSYSGSSLDNNFCIVRSIFGLNI